MSAEESVDEKKEGLVLKQLPDHLRYAFLGSQSAFPIIISSSLSQAEKGRLTKVLRKHKGALAWSISDIKGINPTICMHKILMEECHKPTIEHKRRLNPAMKEVVRAELLKLLNTGIIYAIFDSSWVSPVQVVPKKKGMTIVWNEKNELLPTRTVTRWRVCIIGSLIKPLERTTSHCHSLTRCWIGWWGTNITASWMGIQVTIR